MKTQLIQTRSIPSAPNRLGAKAESAERFQLFESPVAKERKGAEIAPVPKDGPATKGREPVKSERPAERQKPVVKPKFNEIEKPVDQKQYASDRVVSLSAEREPIAQQKPISSEPDQELVADAPQEVTENAQALFVQMEQAAQGAVVPQLDGTEATQVAAPEATEPVSSERAVGKHGSMQMAIEAISKKLEGDGPVNPDLEGKFEALLTKLESHASAHEAHQERLATANADLVKLDKMLSAYGAELVHLGTANAGKAQLTAPKVDTALESEQTLGQEEGGPQAATTVAALKEGVTVIKAVAEQLLDGEQLNEQSREDDGANLAQVEHQKLGESRSKDLVKQSSDLTLDAESVAGASEAGDVAVKAVDQALVSPESDSAQKTARESGQEIKEVTTSAKHGTSPDGAKIGGISDFNQNDLQFHTVKEKAVVQHKISPSAIMEQVREAILKAPLQQGERTEMILQLRPEELGKVELKIEVHKDVVIAKFDVASNMVKETIETNLADLKSSLKDKGFSDMTFDVNVSKERTHEGHGNQGGNGKRRGRGIQALEGMHQKQSVYVQPSLAKLVGESHFEHYA